MQVQPDPALETLPQPAVAPVPEAPASQDPLPPPPKGERVRLLKIVMPSQGDMDLMAQDGGTLVFQPVYYGGDSFGPVFQILSTDGSSSKIEDTYRLRFRRDGEIRLVKAAR